MARLQKLKTVIYQGNTLTTARYNMSPLQKDILYVLQAMVRPDDPAETEYVLRVRDIIADLDRDPANGYTNLKNASWGMMDIKIQLFINNEYVQVVPFQRFIYNEGEGTMRVSIDPIIRSMVTNLTGNYTTFGKESAMKLKSSYAKRLYEMFSQWKDLGIFSVTMQEIRERFEMNQIGRELYPQVGMFMERVIDPAIDKINQHTELMVSYSLIKTGRKFTGLKFRITKRTVEAELFLPTPTDSPGILTEKLVSRFRLRPDQAEEVLQRFTVELIHKKIYEIERQNSSNTIKSLGAYTAKVFGV